MIPPEKRQIGGGDFWDVNNPAGLPEGLMWSTFNDDEEVPNNYKIQKAYWPWDDKFKDLKIKSCRQVIKQ